MRRLSRRQPYQSYRCSVDNSWVRFERDLQAEVDRLFPGEQLVRVCGLRFIVPGVQTMQIKDIKFSNSITVEHNTLGDGAIGHIVRNRQVASDTAVLTDTWFHYDQVGSVLSESDKDGQLVATHYQDAFGVRQADWETGLPGGTREGWAHNTKEIDGGTGLMYMYQRHYIPEYGTFMSRAPYGPRREHEYGFAANDPLARIDPDGRISTLNVCWKNAFGAKGVLGRHYWLEGIVPIDPNDPNSDDEFFSCGQTGSSGGGDTDHSDRTPIDCASVDGAGDDPERARAAMECVCADANDGTWVPWGNDCKNKVEDCLEEAGFQMPNVPRRHPLVPWR
jgi:RHS repeat-associated protein